MLIDLVRRFGLFSRMVAILTFSILANGCSPSSKHLRLDPLSNFEQARVGINDILSFLQSRPLDQLWRIVESDGDSFSGIRIIVFKGFDSAQMVELFFDAGRDLTDAAIVARSNETDWDKYPYDDDGVTISRSVVSSHYFDLSEQQYTQLVNQALSMGLKDLSSMGTEQENAELRLICTHATVYAIEAVIEDELFAIVRSDCDVDVEPVLTLASRLLHTVIEIDPTVSEHTQFMQGRLEYGLLLREE